MSAREAKDRRWLGLLRYRERRLAGVLATRHGRPFIIAALRKSLTRSRVCRLEAELGSAALQALGATPPRMRLTRTTTWAPGRFPVVAMAVLRSWAEKAPEPAAA